MPSSPVASSRNVDHTPIAESAPVENLPLSESPKQLRAAPAFSTLAKQQCASCKQRATNLARCRRGCDLPVFYCSIACQTKHWNAQHKFVCKTPEERELEKKKSEKIKKKQERKMRLEKYRMCKACGNPNCWKAKMYEKLVAEEVADSDEEMFAQEVVA